jgi:hypothetical protein
MWKFVPEQFQFGEFLLWPPNVPQEVRADPVWQNLLRTEGASAVIKRLGEINGTHDANNVNDATEQFPHRTQPQGSVPVTGW